MCARKRKRRSHHSRISASTIAPSQKFFKAPYGRVQAMRINNQKPVIPGVYSGNPRFKEIIDWSVPKCRDLLHKQAEIAKDCIRRYLLLLPRIKPIGTAKLSSYVQYGNYHEYLFSLRYRSANLQPGTKEIMVGLHYVGHQTGTEQWWIGHVSSQWPIEYKFEINCILTQDR